MRLMTSHEESSEEKPASREDNHKKMIRRVDEFRIPAHVFRFPETFHGAGSAKDREENLRDRCPLCNFLYEGKPEVSLALERLTRSFLVSRAPGRRKRLSRGGVEFESNLQMEGRVNVNKQDCFAKFPRKRDGLSS